MLHANGQTGWVDFDVTEDVAAFLAGEPNFGWLLKKTEENQNGKVDYTSREGAAGQRPKLVLLVENADDDIVPPSLAIVEPHEPILVNETSPTVALAFTDGGSGIDTASLVVSVDGSPLSGCSVTADRRHLHRAAAGRRLPHRPRRGERPRRQPGGGRLHLRAAGGAGDEHGELRGGGRHNPAAGQPEPEPGERGDPARPLQRAQPGARPLRRSGDRGGGGRRGDPALGHPRADDLRQRRQLGLHRADGRRPPPHRRLERAGSDLELPRRLRPGQPAARLPVAVGRRRLRPDADGERADHQRPGRPAGLRRHRRRRRLPGRHAERRLDRQEDRRRGERAGGLRLARGRRRRPADAGGRLRRPRLRRHDAADGDAARPARAADRQRRPPAAHRRLQRRGLGGGRQPAYSCWWMAWIVTGEATVTAAGLEFTPASDWPTGRTPSAISLRDLAGNPAHGELDAYGRYRPAAGGDREP